MKKTVPSYIPFKILQATPIQHDWDNEDPEHLLPANDPETQRRLKGIPDVGKLVFAIGCAEWVLARFRRVPAKARVFLQACWAHALNRQRAVPAELEPEEWEGPIRGAICLALMTILNTRYGFDERNAEVDAAFAEQVALHILPDRRRFLVWRDQVLERLKKVDAMSTPAPAKRSLRRVLNPDAPL